MSTSDKQDYQRQISELTKIVKEHKYKKYEIFAEAISSYKKDQRHKLQSLLSQIEKDPKYFDCIYTTEISRIGRNPTETRRIIDRLTDLGVPVYIQSLNQKTIEPNGKRNMMMNIILQVLMEYANFEAETFKIRSKSGLRLSASNGKAGGSNNHPYGYYKDKNKMLSINEEEAIVVRRIYNYCLKGLGTRKIAGILNTENIPTRYNKSFKKPIEFKDGRLAKDPQNIIWADGVIYGVLKNSIYKGDRKFKGEIFHAPPIITTGNWENVQHILSEKFNSKTKTTRYLYLLKKLLICGVCGRNYFGRYKTGGHDKFYMCSSRRTTNGNCGNKGISIEIVESIVWSYLKYNNTLKLMYINSEENDESIQVEISNLRRDVENQKKEIENKNKEKERVFQLYIKSHIKESKYLLETQKIDREIKKNQDVILFNEKSIQRETNKIDDSSTYDKLYKNINRISSDRNSIAKTISIFIEKVIIQSYKENYFFLTIHFLGKPLPQTLLFDKKAKDYSLSSGSKSLRYNKEGGLKEDKLKYLFAILSKTMILDRHIIEIIKFDKTDMPNLAGKSAHIEHRIDFSISAHE